VSVHLNPEQAVVVGEAIRTGLIETPDDVVNVGVETIRQRLGTTPATPLPSSTADAVPVQRAKNLVELFADSPFKGANLEFERDKDTGRDIEL